MITRLALAVLTLSCLCIGGCYALAWLPGGAPAWAVWGLSLGGPGALAAMMLFGAARGGRIQSAAAGAIALTFLVLVSAFGLALLLPAAEGPGAVLLLGLPRRTAIVLYGVGVLPLLFLPVAYAASFDAPALSDDALARLRAEAASTS